MSTFRFYSVKLLPISGTRADLVGDLGYGELLKALEHRITNAHKSKKFEDVFYALRNEFYMTILHIHAYEKYTPITFIKFDSPKSLVNTFTGNQIQDLPEGTSAHRYEFFAIFDYENHVLAVQNKTGRLPSPAIFIDSLRFFFEPVAREKFPNHVLKIDQLTNDNALSNVYVTAEKYRRVEVEISLSNSDEYIDDEVNETERELEMLGISEVSHTEKAVDGGFMSNISKKCRHYLTIAKKNGNAKIRYLERQSQRVKTFVMRDHPLQVDVTQKKGQKNEEYEQEIREAISYANKRTLKAE